MVHSPSCRTTLAGIAITASMLSSCTPQPATVPRPDPSPPGAAASATPAGSQPAAQPSVLPSSQDSARLRALDGVGQPAAGAQVACATSRRVRLDADSVALRFTAAFMKVGILPIRLSLPSVDGVAAGPADVDTPAPSRISARARTEARGDSTAYRVEFHVAPPLQGWTPADSAVATGHVAGLCSRVEVLAFPSG